ncbi:MAG TPA: hypothetical protein VG841_04705 [Caulobacterales bacterium]|nr:hypothetical protein [Caulobacterales bacterium]
MQPTVHKTTQSPPPAETLGRLPRQDSARQDRRAKDPDFQSRRRFDDLF